MTNYKVFGWIENAFFEVRVNGIMDANSKDQVRRKILKEMKASFKIRPVDMKVLKAQINKKIKIIEIK